jgi:hypothetical protein
METTADPEPVTALPEPVTALPDTTGGYAATPFLESSGNKKGAMLRSQLSRARQSHISNLSESIKTGDVVYDRAPKNTNYERIIAIGQAQKYRNFNNMVTAPITIDSSMEFSVSIAKWRDEITTPIY